MLVRALRELHERELEMKLNTYFLCNSIEPFDLKLQILREEKWENNKHFGH